MTKPNRASASLATMFVAVLVAGFSLFGCSNRTQPSAKGCEEPWREPDRSLNPGYVLLYETMDAFSGMDKVLLVKRESDPFEELLESVADYAGHLADQLEELDERDDQIDLEGVSLPEVIGAARKAMGAEVRETVGGPFKGATGSELERTLLQSLDLGLSESHYLVRALARRESSEERHAILQDANQKLGGLSRAVKRQLEARHFCDKAGMDHE